jgi:hypothetical protein
MALSAVNGFYGIQNLCLNMKQLHLLMALKAIFKTSESFLDKVCERRKWLHILIPINH